MRFLVTITALAALCGTIAPAYAQQSPFKQGYYVCASVSASTSGAIEGRFQITGRKTYVEGGRKGTFEFNRGTGIVTFDNGKQYGLAHEGFMVLLRNGEPTQTACLTL